MLPWAQKTGIRFPNNINLAHKISSTASQLQKTPLRGIFTERKIAKGQLIAIIPLHQSALLPRQASRFLTSTTSMTTTNQITSTNENNGKKLIYQSALKMASQNPFTMEMLKRSNDNRESAAASSSDSSSSFLLPWFTRDQIVISAALATWRMKRKMEMALNQNNNAELWNPFDDYLKILPKGIPFAATEQRNQEQAQERAEQEQERGQSNVKSFQRAQSRFATPLDVRPNLSSSAKSNEHVGNKRSTHVPTSSFNLEETLTSNKHLTQPGHIGLLGKSVNYLSLGFANAFVQEYLSSNNNNHNNNDSLPSSIQEDRLVTEARNSFEWAHFMLRSRSMAPLLSVNSSSDSGATSKHNDGYDTSREFENESGEEEVLLSGASSFYNNAPLLLPFVDMLNHSMTSANVTVAWNRGASLTNAANPDEVEILVSASGDIAPGSELLLNYADHRQRGRFMFAPDRHLRLPVEALYANPREHAAVSRLLAAQRQSGVCEDVASWEWQFGFAIPQAELDFVRELLWARSLKGRVRRMMNVRRRGRPGEFVVGVPEGLASLKRQRERLEKDMYGGRTIFPPHAE